LRQDRGAGVAKTGGAKMLTALHLFCGAGLGTAGLVKAGIEVICGNDIDDKALSVHRYRFANCKTIEGDICSYSSSAFPDTDIILGGSPCTAFSSGGMQQGIHSEIGSLSFEYVRVVLDKQPRGILFENVPGMLSSPRKVKDRPPGTDYLEFLSALSEAGYSGCSGVIDGTHWAPQLRQRIYLIGVRNDLLDLGQPCIDLNVQALAGVFPLLSRKAPAQIANHFFKRLSAFKEKTLSISNLADASPPPSLKFCCFGLGQLLSVDAEFENFAYHWATLQNVLEKGATAFVMRAAAGERVYTRFAPTIRGMNWQKRSGYRQPGTGHMKVRMPNGETRPPLPTEIERIMGEMTDCTRYGLSHEGKLVELSANERIKMLSMGMLPGAITDMASCLKGLLVDV
jgi:DNA-cytosine methyltransferase